MTLLANSGTKMVPGTKMYFGEMIVAEWSYVFLFITTKKYRTENFNVRVSKKVNFIAE